MSKTSQYLLIALDGIPVGRLEATATSYRFQYFPEYESAQAPIPLSLSYPLGKGPWDFAFAGELPPYFFHLLPEGWLREIAETSHLPMNTPLEKLAVLCRENLGAIEIYETDLSHLSDYEAMRGWVRVEKAKNLIPQFFLTNEASLASYPQWSHCLRCHEELPRVGYNANYHDECSLQFFGIPNAPSLNINSSELRKIAEEQLLRHESLTGVQPKFSATFKDKRDSIRSFRYIVKPEPRFQRLEDGVSYKHSSIAELIAMHFAELLELDVAETALIYLNGEQAALVSKRFDRNDSVKIHTEDFAQVLSVRDKYKGSHEQIANQLKKIPDPKQSLYDLTRFFKSIIFNFIIGNADAHLKNYSLVHTFKEHQAIYKLSPLYDLMPVLLFASKDQDQLALTLCGKRRKLKKKNFQELAIKLGLNVSLLTEFTDEIEENLTFYFKGFELFGVPQEIIKTHRDFVEQQVRVLKERF